MEGISLYPVYLVDFTGAIIMVVFSVIAVYEAYRLRRERPDSVLFSYLFWLCIAFAAFSISRSFGHTLRFLFIWAGHPEVWRAISPFSGGLNTLTFAVAATLTFYYPNVTMVIARIRAKAEDLKRAKDQLEKAHDSLTLLNRTLERRVEERSQELLASERKFRRLFQGSRDLIFFCDREFQITDLNQWGANILGYESPEDVRGRSLASFFHEDKEWDLFVHQLTVDGFVKDFETMFSGRRDEPIFLMITAEGLQGPQDGIDGYAGIAKDITSYRRMTENLIYSEKMAAIGQMAAGIAHEVNTPLGIILGYTQMLKDDLSNDQERFADLETIERQTKNCKRIVHDLLSFARSSSAPESGPVDLAACVRHTMSVMQHSFEMDSIDIHLAIQEDLPHVLADGDRINQVVLNLLTNAHDAIGQKGLIALFLYFDEKREAVVLEVGDSGAGIPPEIRDRIFEPFFTTKPVGKGTGLGLSVSYGIINEYGGEIEVLSPPLDESYEKYGLNTLFRISFYQFLR